MWLRYYIKFLIHQDPKQTITANALENTRKEFAQLTIQ